MTFEGIIPVLNSLIHETLIDSIIIDGFMYEVMQCCNCDKIIILDAPYSTDFKSLKDYHLTTKLILCINDDGTAMMNEEGRYLAANRGEE